ELVRLGRLPDPPQQPMPFVEARPAAAVPPMCRLHHHIPRTRPIPKRPHRQAVPGMQLLPAREALQAPRPCSAHMEEGYQQVAAGTPLVEAVHRLAQNVEEPRRTKGSRKQLWARVVFNPPPRRFR
ncbi:unnamed protein product, partial [Symbiodinium sp. CCMP2456]